MESFAQRGVAHAQQQFGAKDTEMPRQQRTNDPTVRTSSSAQRAFCRILGGNVLAQRQRHEWSPAELAKACSMNAGELQQIEGGNLRPSGAQLVAMAQALGEPITTFFRGIESL